MMIFLFKKSATNTGKSQTRGAGYHTQSYFSCPLAIVCKTSQPGSLVLLEDRWQERLHNGHTSEACEFTLNLSFSVGKDYLFRIKAGNKAQHSGPFKVRGDGSQFEMD